MRGWRAGAGRAWRHCGWSWRGGEHPPGAGTLILDTRVGDHFSIRCGQAAGPGATDSRQQSPACIRDEVIDISVCGDLMNTMVLA